MTLNRFIPNAITTISPVTNAATITATSNCNTNTTTTNSSSSNTNSSSPYTSTTSTTTITNNKATSTTTNNADAKSNRITKKLNSKRISNYQPSSFKKHPIDPSQRQSIITLNLTRSFLTNSITADLIRLDEAELLPFYERLRSGIMWHEDSLTAEKECSPSSSSAINYDPRTTIQPITGWRLIIVIFTLMFGLFLSTVETSITATALVRIGTYFNNSFASNWVVLSYLLTYMGFSVIFARLSDAIGRKSAILLSWFLFTTFSLASGLATSLNQLIIFRSFQGIGGSGLFTMAMTVAPQIAPSKYWSLLSGCLGVALACSSLVGPILGGVITEKIGWRWIYLFNAPAAGIVLIPFLLAWPKSQKTSNQTRTLLLTQVDVPGALLILAASTLLVFALDQGGSYRRSWNSVAVVASLVISAVCWVAFVGWISFLEAGKFEINIKPIFPLKKAMSRPIGPAILMAFLTGMPFFIIIINLPIRFQLLNGNSPTMAGLHLMPLLALSATGSALGGAASVNKNRSFYSLLIASILICIGTALLSTISITREIQKIQYLYQAILGLGIGLSLSSVNVMTGLASSMEQLASTNGAVNQARVLGGSIGLSIGNIILNNKINSDLKSVLTANEVQSLRHSISLIVNLARHKQIEVVRVFGNTFNDLMRFCFYISIAGLIVTCMTWEREPADVEAYKAQQSKIAESQADVP